MMANYCLLAVLNQEKTIHKIGEFDKTKLKHAETEVKNPLPDKEGERSAFYSDLLWFSLSLHHNILIFMLDSTYY